MGRNICGSNVVLDPNFKFQYHPTTAIATAATSKTAFRVVFRFVLSARP